mmetsp:Transcript_12172/g.29015  ORF Transcript_12172/g.29015 Transcript_12172/m.29015 type:complete len:572 (+) Transcript_12172:125-1840(+)
MTPPSSFISCWILLCFTLCLPPNTNVVVTAVKHHQATIKALDTQHIYLPATSTSYTVVLEYFPKPITQLNISHVVFQTMSRQDYCQTYDDDSSNNKYCNVQNTVVTDLSMPRYLHLVLLHLPPDCIKDDDSSTAGQNDHHKCDWTQLGIGNRRNAGALDDLCCTAEKHHQGECEHAAQLILNPDKFLGQERLLEVPPVVNMTFAVGDVRGVFDIPQGGEYAFLMANCNDNGWDLLSLPQMMAESSGPSYLEGLVDYYASLTFYHVSLFLAYVFAVMVIPDYPRPIQKWLGATMVVAALDVLLKCINYRLWDWDWESWFNVFTVSVTTEVLKRGISMCVGVMVAKGWGTVRTSLGDNAVAIAIFGFLYTAIVLSHDISNAIGETNLKNEIMVQGGDLMAMGGILACMVFVMDILFVVWILVSVRGTIVHLKSIGRYDQVSHHRILGGLLTFFILAITPAWIIQFVDRFQSRPLLTAEQWCYMNATVQGIYTITLTGVATLWIPKRDSQNLQEECMEMKELNCGNDNADNHDERYDEDLLLEEQEEEARPMDLDSGNDPGHPNGLPVNIGHLS